MNNVINIKDAHPPKMVWVCLHCDSDLFRIVKPPKQELMWVECGTCGCIHRELLVGL